MNQKWKVALLALAPLLLLALGAFVGAKLQPPPPEKVKIEHTHTREVVTVVDEKALEALREQLRQMTTKMSSMQASIHREKRTLEHPNGMKETTEVEDINVSKVVKEQEIKYVDREVVKFVDRHTSEKTTEIEKQRIEIDAPVRKWSVTVLAGVEFKHLDVTTTAPYVKPLVVGGVVERKLGKVPFLDVDAKAGIWGLSNGTGGVSVGVNF